MEQTDGSLLEAQVVGFNREITYLMPFKKPLGLATGARIQLYLDPLSDTVLGLANCQVTAAGTADDVLLGGANVLLDGEKSETNGLANGDFELVFANWLFTPAGQTLYRDVFGNPLFAPQFVFNANVTQLGGALGNDHRPEGSGNIFWRD